MKEAFEHSINFFVLDAPKHSGVHCLIINFFWKLGSKFKRLLAHDVDANNGRECISGLINRWKSFEQVVNEMGLG